MGPQYAKVKKAPTVKDEEEAKALLGKILPKYVTLNFQCYISPYGAHPSPSHSSSTLAQVLAQVLVFLGLGLGTRPIRPGFASKLTLLVHSSSE